MANNKSNIVASDIDLQKYGQWRDSIKLLIRQARFRAVMQLNASNLAHYFHLGREILLKQQEMGWGAKVIDMLSVDLTQEFGKNSGYSTRNLKYMRQFALEYPDFPFVQVPLAQMQEQKNWQALLAKLPADDPNHPALLKHDDTEFVQVPLAQITWYHHISLLHEVKDPITRVYYIIKSAQEGWSRDVMLLQYHNGAHKAEGMAITNFERTLPPADSDLARYMFKDPYNFAFVDMSQVKRETDLENQLVLKISEFLTEMGHDFAYVGHQVKLDQPADNAQELDEDEARVDLLMYHLRQHRYVAIELKVTPFKP